MDRVDVVEGPGGERATGSEAWGYRVVRFLARMLLGIFYRRIDVTGIEQVPLTGPLIVAANHHNSVVDAMVLIAFIPRRLRVLANAPLFRHPLMGPFLRLLGALSVHRRHEGGSDPGRNAALFAATTGALREGHAILLFPEGRTQPEPVLLELRTGAARMLLAAEQAGASVALLPVGLVFQRPGTFRAGCAHVVIGDPIRSTDAYPAGTAPESEARALTGRLAEALRGLIVEAGDRSTLQVLMLADEMWHAATAPGRDGEMRLDWLRRATLAYGLLTRRDSTRVAALREDLKGLAAEVNEMGPAITEMPFRLSGRTGHLMARSFSLLVTAPLALVGSAIHVLPYRLTGAIVRRIPHTDEEDATDKIATGFLIYPLAWIAEAWVVSRWAGGWALVLFAGLLAPTGLFAVAWRERLNGVAREARALLRVCRDPDLPRRARERRAAVIAELEALGRLVPEVWAR